MTTKILASNYIQSGQNKRGYTVIKVFSYFPTLHASNVFCHVLNVLRFSGASCRLRMFAHYLVKVVIGLLDKVVKL